MLLALIALWSCKPDRPSFVLGEKSDFVEDKNKSIIRSLVIEKYDTINNFVGKKYIYKNPDSDGKSKIYLFAPNEGYHVTGDSLNLKKGFTYRLYIKTLGFADTLILNNR